MPTVSEQVGTSEFQQFRQSVESLLLGAMEIMSEKTHQFRYTDESMEGAGAILKHIRSGKQAGMQAVEGEDAALFASILKHNGIPYAEVAEGNGEKHIFLTRDSDGGKLEEVWNQYAFEIGKGFREMGLEEFLQSNEEQQVMTAEGYSEAELEVFRKEAAEAGISYAVAYSEGEPDRFDILFVPRDEAEVMGALLKMELGFSGRDGAVYRAEVQQNLDRRAGMIQQIKDAEEPLYLVDTKDPSRFYSVSDGFLVGHQLVTETVRGSGGKERQIVKDKLLSRTAPFGDRELRKAMHVLGECAVLTEKEMVLVRGLDAEQNDKQNALVRSVEETAEAHKLLKEKLKGAPGVYQEFTARKNRENGEIEAAFSEAEMREARGRQQSHRVTEGYADAVFAKRQMEREYAAGTREREGRTAESRMAEKKHRSGRRKDMDRQHTF